MTALEDIAEDATYYTTFGSNDGTGEAIAPSAAFAEADFKIYKDGSNVEKSTTNGIVATSPFDSEDGVHKIAIDTSNDTGDAGFWVVGSKYEVWLIPSTTTVDGKVIKHKVGEFTIGVMARAAAIAALNNLSTADIDNRLYAAGLPQSPRNTYYVNPTTGNDGNNGLSSGAAWQTIVYALTQIVDGDLVILEDGTYSERIVANGVYETPVTIKAQNYKGAVIQFSSNNYCWEFDGGASKNWIIEGVDFKPTDGNANGAFVRFDDDCENITFKDVGLTPPDDGGSTANGFQNAAAAKLTNIVFDGVRGDLANQMGFARLTGQVKNVRVINSRITRHTTGLSIDDMSGEFYIDRSRLEGSDTNIWIRTPNQSGGEAKITVGDHCTLVSSAGYGIRVNGSAAYMPTLDVGSSTLDTAESSIYAEEYIQGGSIRNTTVKSNGSTPAVAISADGATNYVGHFDIDNLKCRNLSGHGLLIGQNCVGANIRRSNVHGGDQGVVLKGENILFADNDATSETGSAILLKGAIDTVIDNNRVNMNGTSGTIRGIDVREQDAGVLDQRNPDRILISNNDINVSGSAAIGYYLDASNIGNDIREDGNRVQTKDGAVAANILGTAVADSASWNAAYAAYAITNNGVFSTINQVVAPTAIENAAVKLKYSAANVEDDADCEVGSEAHLLMASLNGDISNGPLQARKFGNNSVFDSRTRGTDTTNERTVRVGPDV